MKNKEILKTVEDMDQQKLINYYDCY